MTMTTVTKGTVGVGSAIYFFTNKGYVVSIPITDNQPYDIVVDRGDGLEKVSVKYTSQKSKYGIYICELKSVRPNRNKNVVKKFDERSCDIVFIATSSGEYYLIPSKNIPAKTALALGDKVAKYKVSVF